MDPLDLFLGCLEGAVLLRPSRNWAQQDCAPALRIGHPEPGEKAGMIFAGGWVAGFSAPLGLTEFRGFDSFSPAKATLH
jgi:hypothetical protein